MNSPNGPALDTPGPGLVPPARAPGAGAASRDRPWLMRTYAGHSTAKESNALFRRNLAKGQDQRARPTAVKIGRNSAAADRSAS